MDLEKFSSHMAATISDFVIPFGFHSGKTVLTARLTEERQSQENLQGTHMSESHAAARMNEASNELGQAITS